MKTLILASQSPFRRKLLSQLGVPFDVSKADLDEKSFEHDASNPVELSQLLSQKKAEKVWESNKESLVIGSDQVCHMGEQIFQKPQSREKAIEQLKLLSGKEHQLSTSYSIISRDGHIQHTNITTLFMKKLSDHDIELYLDYDQPYQCCGSYMIESGGIALFDKILADDFTAIIGLPLIQLSNDLRRLGITPWQK